MELVEQGGEVACLLVFFECCIRADCLVTKIDDARLVCAIADRLPYSIVLCI